MGVRDDVGESGPRRKVSACGDTILGEMSTTAGSAAEPSSTLCLSPGYSALPHLHDILIVNVYSS